MVKTNTEYRTPNCEVVNVHVQNLVCASPYGLEGGAGPDVPVEDDEFGY